MTNPRPTITQHHLKSWLPALIWASLIFVFSTDVFSAPNTAGVIGSLLSALIPGISDRDAEFVHAVVRKLGHFSEYFIFTVLLMRALRTENAGQIETRHLLISLAIAILYALSDELHQAFVPSRTASLVDVLIDGSGGISGVFWSHLRNRGKKSTS